MKERTPGRLEESFQCVGPWKTNPGYHVGYWINFVRLISQD